MRRVLEFAWGATRFVILIGPWALKFPRFPRPRRWSLFLYGLLSNIQESLWSACDDRLGRVLFSIPGGWLLVMERYAPVSGDEVEAWFLAGEAPFHRDRIDDHPSNFGRAQDGSIKLLDYGEI